MKKNEKFGIALVALALLLAYLFRNRLVGMVTTSSKVWNGSQWVDVAVAPASEQALYAKMLPNEFINGEGKLCSKDQLGRVTCFSGNALDALKVRA